MKEKIYLLKITLRDIEPEICRRFVVPQEIRLHHLHYVLQIVMGWEACHLYQFRFGTRRFMENPKAKDDGSPCQKHHLQELITRKHQVFQYLYDFGDGWVHDIKVLDILDQDWEYDLDYSCIDGERACPPEDVGGVPGYQYFCEALADIKHPEHQRWMEWSGGQFNADHFDLAAVNTDLKKFRLWAMQ